MTPDSASAYEIHAQRFLRERSACGADVVGTWARALPRAAEILELGCGGGWPVSQALAAAGHRLWAVDSSPTLLAVFRSRFPTVPTLCSRVQECTYFGRRFDAVIAVGLVFLLPLGDQASLLQRMGEVLRPGGRFLFSAPLERGSWVDRATGHTCRSPGRIPARRSRRRLSAAGGRTHGGATDRRQRGPPAPGAAWFRITD